MTKCKSGRGQFGGDGGYRYPFPLYRGSPYQRGYGVASRLFHPLLRNFIVPLLKTGAKSIGRRFLETGIKVGRDYLRGKTLKKSIKKRTRQSAEKMLVSGIKGVQDLVKPHLRKGRARADIFNT